MKEVTVDLGGRKFSIAALNIQRSRQWRETFARPFEELVGVMAAAGGIELTNAASLGKLVGVLKDTLLHSTDLLLDALFAYAPVLQAEREWIEEHATDEEALTALMEVLRLAYPLGVFASLVRGRANQPT